MFRFILTLVLCSLTFASLVMMAWYGFHNQAALADSEAIRAILYWVIATGRLD